MKENIPKIMDKLAEYYNYNERTTLNRMRQKPDAFRILISCLLSLRTKDAITEEISERLFERISNPCELLEIPVDELERIIFKTGHYRKKARILQSVSRELIERFDGKVPSSREELLSIKGVGPKTANIVLSFAFGKDVLPIDTHCHRIPNRLGWVSTRNPEETEKELEKILPRKYWREFNALFVLFGKEICQPVSPWCSKCVVKQECLRKGVEKSR